MRVGAGKKRDAVGFKGGRGEGRRAREWTYYLSHNQLMSRNKLTGFFCRNTDERMHTAMLCKCTTYATRACALQYEEGGEGAKS